MIEVRRAPTPALSGGSATAWLTGATYPVNAVRADAGFAWTDTLGGLSTVAPSADMTGRWIRGGALGGNGTETQRTDMGTTLTASLTTSFVPITGTDVSDILDGGKYDLQIVGSFGTANGATMLLRVFDVTAGAAGRQLTAPCVVGATGCPVNIPLPVAPAAGARTYRLEWAVGSGTTTGALYGADLNQTTYLRLVKRG